MFSCELGTFLETVATIDREQLLEKQLAFARISVFFGDYTGFRLLRASNREVYVISVLFGKENIY